MSRLSPPVALVSLALCFAAAAAVALAVPALGLGGSSSPELRPDLVQKVPSDLETRKSGSRFELGFTSAVENHGDGPLRVNGRRSGAKPDMTAEQLVRRLDGSHTRVAGVGPIRYTRSQGHHHWHFLRFDAYELRKPNGELARPDQKTGFCLGDRYDSGQDFPNKPDEGPLNTSCALYQPEARSVMMGISVGYGDDYHPYLEGQSIDITGLPGGEYVLSHTANRRHRLRETTYANNAASVRIRLRSSGTTSGQPPSVAIVRSCPQSASCPPPG